MLFSVEAYKSISQTAENSFSASTDCITAQFVVNIHKTHASKHTGGIGLCRDSCQKGVLIIISLYRRCYGYT